MYQAFEQIHNYLYANEGLSESEALETAVGFIARWHLQEMPDESRQRLISGFGDWLESAEDLSSEASKFLSETLGQFDLNTIPEAVTPAFQKFISSHSKGRHGQFFTPEPIVEFMVQFINPSKDDWIIDPACGTAGFLSSAYRHTGNAERLVGVEINQKIAQLGSLRLLLETGSAPSIHTGNAIEMFAQGEQQILNDSFDVVLANPPFGTQGKISQAGMLEHFDLGHKWDRPGQTKSSTLADGRPPEILFLELCLKLLKPEGKLGIVLPDGMLDNVSQRYVRSYASSLAELEAVVKLPDGTFIPYGTGVKTSLVFMRRKPHAGTGYVFYSQITKLGYTTNKKGAPVMTDGAVDEDFSLVLDDKNNLVAGSSPGGNNSFMVPAADTASRWDYPHQNPDVKAMLKRMSSAGAVKLGDLCEIVNTKSPLLKDDQPVRYVELSGIHAKTWEIFNDETLHPDDLPSRASWELKTGDVITAVAGNSIGTAKHATAYVTEQHDGCVATNGLRVLRNPEVDSFYLLYYLANTLFLEQILRLRTGAAIPAVSDQDFRNVLIWIPEQSQIEHISSTMKEAFRLRQQSRRLTDRLRLKLP